MRRYLNYNVIDEVGLTDCLGGFRINCIIYDILILRKSLIYNGFLLFRIINHRTTSYRLSHSSRSGLREHHHDVSRCALHFRHSWETGAAPALNLSKQSMAYGAANANAIRHLLVVPDW